MGRRKTPPFPEYDEWTTARFWQFIRSALRSAYMRWPPKFQAMVRSRRNVTGKRHKYEYLCVECGGWFMGKEVQVDHIVPAGTLKVYSDLPLFVERLFVGVDKLQVMCKPCHKVKTKEERVK